MYWILIEVTRTKNSINDECENGYILSDYVSKQSGLKKTRGLLRATCRAEESNDKHLAVVPKRS